MRPRRELSGKGGQLDSLFEVLLEIEERCSEPLRGLGAHAIIRPGLCERLPGQLCGQRLVASEPVQSREGR